MYHDRTAKFQHFDVGDLVWVKRTIGKGYEAGCIVESLSGHSYWVEMGGRTYRKHADHLRVRLSNRLVPPKQVYRDHHHQEYQSMSEPDVEAEHELEEQCCNGPQEVPEVADREDPLLMEREGEDEPTEDQEMEMGRHVDERQERGSKENSPVDVGRGGSLDLEGTVNQALPRRSTRLKRPPVRPYDKYLENPKLK